jgi:quercetin dioxygenase-like cupin family protein
MAAGLDSAAMSAYTRKNLLEADDSSPDGLDMEARFGRKHLDSRQLGVSYFRYGPGVRPPYGHRHREQEEAYVVVSGSGRLKLDDEVIDLAQWDVVRVAPEVARGFEGGPDGLVIVAVGGTKPEGGDGELVNDFWPA